MKFVTSQLAYFLQNRSTRRNVQFLFKFLLLLLFVVTLYSVLFHYLMTFEEREFTWLTGFYWTLTVMSTLGFGDITFTSDIGRVFSIVVLLSGIIFLLVMLPFTFIQFFYAPWLEAQQRSRAPRELDPETRDHVIIVGTDATAQHLAEKLSRYGHDHIILCPDVATTLALHDLGLTAAVGDYDDPETFKRMRVGQAAMVVALEDDVRNTNITFTVREVSPAVPVVCGADKDEALDILALAGSTHVLQFTKLLGHSLARRSLAGAKRSSVAGQFESLIVAEAPVMRTSLVGRSLRDSGLREAVGVNVVGVWERGRFRTPNPDTPLSPSTVLVLAGTEEQIAAFDAFASQETAARNEDVPAGPVLILGGGRVGMAAAAQLRDQGIHYCIVEKNPKVALSDANTVTGSAADLDVLEQAGIREAPSVFITTHDDDMNIYLTIYCRKLRPDVQIITRATLDRNIGILHTAGADLVMSYASLVANTVINLLSPGKVLMLTEGLNIFRASVPKRLAGMPLLNSGIRDKTGCSVVAVHSKGGLEVNPDPSKPLQEGDEFFLIGDTKAEQCFLDRFGEQENG